MNISIVEMNQDHIPSAATLEKICFSMPWSENSFASAMSANTRFFAALLDGKLIAYCGMQVIDSEGFITNIAVHPDYRRQGIGRKVLKHLISFAQNNNIKSISLEVRQSNTAAIKLYESEGFECVGTRKNFYEKPTEDGLIYTKFFKERFR
ncbi:MAG TPA: ribosomal protein S18-alanine N-acetyltransferase [Clostridiales bacterium]|nr:ribosomal protein S18-alanine N-acetyltransferase [Clostridiales bacterium]